MEPAHASACPLCLTGARILLGVEMVDQPLTRADGRVAEGDAPELDLTGYLVLPGIIDLHGDGFERHLTPRPTAPFDKRSALRSATAELAVNGVTAAWLSQSWSWEGGFRSKRATCDLLEALTAERAALLADVRVQIRLKTHVTEAFFAVEQAVARHGVDYVVFNNHLPEAVEMADTQPARFAQWAAQTKRSADEMLAIVRAAQAQDPHVPTALPRIAAAFGPMGAPNVVPLDSQSGNIAAQALIEAGLCDGLVSDYYCPARCRRPGILWTSG